MEFQHSQFVTEQRAKHTAVKNEICAKHGVTLDQNSRYDGWVSKLNAVLAPDGDVDAPEVTALVNWGSLIHDLEQKEIYG